MKQWLSKLSLIAKQYMKHGLAMIIPVALVGIIIGYIYDWTSNRVESFITWSNKISWIPDMPLDTPWFEILTVFGLILTIVLMLIIVGVVFKHLKLFKWAKNSTEKYIIDNIPVLNKVYNFGKEITDTFISDVKEDGDMTVVEVNMGNISMMGLLTDVKNDLVFVVSAPSPLTGFVMKTKNYKILDMSYMDLIQINTSLGRISGSKWNKGITKKKWEKEKEEIKINDEIIVLNSEEIS